MFLELLAFSPLLLLPLLFFILNLSGDSKTSNNSKLPKSYPIIGSFPAIYKNYANRLRWFTDLVKTSSTSTITMHHSLGKRFVVTANPAVVQHILKTKFHIYQKGESLRTTLQDLLGDGIFNADGDNWKFQRQLSSHEFNTKSLRKFVEQVVDTELYDRLIPILSKSSNERTVLDFQDILQRFAFDNICRIGFGYDPEYLLPSLPQAKFAAAFDDAVQISSDRFTSMRPVWKIKRTFGIGSESHLRRVVSDVREFANTIVRQKKREMDEMKTLESHDLLSRFLSSGHSDEKFVTDMVISFTLAGRDTTSAALTWFFWLVANHPSVESEILKEINEKVETGSGYDEVKDMVYTHAALCESMRLYPPVPTDSKEAVEEDVLPDGTKVKKGMTVTYHVYAMGRMEQIWGEDWAEFRPERWLERDVAADKWKFVGKDSFSYPVFQAGPRICLGKEMAFLQMKRVVGGVLKRFKVVSEKRENGKEPEFVAFLTAKMKDLIFVAGASIFASHNSVEEAETDAVLHGILLAAHHKLKDISLECDSQSVIKALRDPNAMHNWRISPLLLRINNLLSMFNSVCWNWIPREANRAADAAAKLAKLKKCSSDWTNRPPSSIVSVLRNDGLPGPPVDTTAF